MPTINCARKEPDMFGDFKAPEWAVLAAPRPPQYSRLVQHGLTGLRIPPWYILDVPEAASMTQCVADLFPARRFVVFAMRGDRDEVLCWDANQMDHRIYSIEGYNNGPQWSTITSRGSVYDWLRSAICEMMDFEALEDWVPQLTKGQHASDVDNWPKTLKSHFRRATWNGHAAGDTPEWLSRTFLDPHYQLLRHLELTDYDWYPWTFLSDVGVSRLTSDMATIFPDRKFVVYARHIRRDTIACWDADTADHCVFVVHDWLQGANKRHFQEFPNMYGWFQSVIEDFINADEEA